MSSAVFRATKNSEKIMKPLSGRFVNLKRSEKRQWSVPSEYTRTSNVEIRREVHQNNDGKYNEV